MASGLARPAHGGASAGIERLIAPVERSLGLAAESTFARTLAGGAIVCVIYAIIQLAYNGVSLDEVIPPAQIITGAVQYPAGHPHELYYKHAYSLLHYLAAGLFWVSPRQTTVAGVFNFLWLFASTFVPFALVTLLTRRAVWGYIAVTLVVLGGALSFRGVYPLFVFPAFMSNGHVGAHAAIFAMVLMMAGMWRSAGFLLGLLPAVHAAMALLVWPWAGLFFLFGMEAPAARARRDIIVWGALGLVLSVVLLIIVRAQPVAPVMPPYDVVGNAAQIYRNFTYTTDEHRRLFPFISLGYLVNPLAFFSLGAMVLAWSRSRAGMEVGILRGRIAWLLVFGGMVWAVVYAARVYRGLVGPLPGPLEMAMPFRYSNLSALLLIPLTITAIAVFVEELSPRDRRVALFLLAATLLGAGVGLRFDRAFVGGYVLVIVWGLMFALAIQAKPRGAARVAVLASLIATGVGLLALREPRPRLYWLLGAGAFYLLAMHGGGLLSRRVAAPPDGWGPWARRFALAACAAVSLVALKIRGSETTWEHVSEFDREINAWLAANGRPGEPILPATFPYTALQAKTGFPVLMHWETLYLMAYTPAVAPAVNALVRDITGIDYSRPDGPGNPCGGRITAWCPAFTEAWKSRSRDDWRRLGDKYGFRLVLGRSDVPLDLTPVVRGPEWTLHTIP